MATTTRTRTTTLTDFSDAAVEAVSHYLARQARAEDPAGKFDRAGRFYLSEACGRDCLVRWPSRKWPYSQMLHGRTLDHVARVLRADVKEARRLLRLCQQ